MTVRRGIRRPSAAIASMVVLFALVAGMFVLNARAVSGQRDAALTANIAGRQRGDVERYVKDVILVSVGQHADPEARLQVVRATAAALVHGGTLTALQGGGEMHVAGNRGSTALRRKLTQEARLTERLAGSGNDLLAQPPGSPASRSALQRLRVSGAILSSVTSDVVGEITKENRDQLHRLRQLELALGAGSAVAAVAMALAFRRDGRSREATRSLALANHSSDLVVVLGGNGAMRYVSPSAAAVLGYEPTDVLGRDLMDLVHPDDQDLLRAVLDDVAAPGGSGARVEWRFLHRRGHWCVIDGVWSDLRHDRAVGGLVANCRDITDRKQLEHELRRQAFLDDLTGLPNRALFGDRVAQAVQRAKRTASTVTVLYVDLDGFKTVNDSLGHGAGDRLLALVGERLASCVRATDTAARLGGDEFGVLLEDGSVVDLAETMADRILTALRDPFEVDGSLLAITASVGIACQSAATVTAEELQRDADVAMYVAKANGKARYEVFVPKMHGAAVERQQLGTDVQLALANGELEVHYQPLVRLATGNIDGVEALLRWHHPERGDVPPLTFVPVAEEVGAIVAIGRWVLEEACAQLRRWDEEIPSARGLAVTVNLSPHQLNRAGLADDVRRAIALSGIAPKRLVLEITEGALIGDIDAVIGRLGALSALGVRLAIDDFGTGYSSLSQLRRLPIDMLKIDKSFIDDAGRTGKGRALLQSIIDLGGLLDLEVVAEGIEDRAQAVALRESGSDLGQGFFYARPAAPGTIGDLLRRGLIDVGATGATSPT
ncbi:MAG: diguanylate cyclase/phosphodiesterase with sensor(s) [Acidimicrobiales bacterium]|nr:diguanylate cyclase/phosphodiesterase with sensor(s) [Acidimicrobiales bacterium]